MAKVKVEKSRKNLKPWHLFLIGLVTMLVGTFIIGRFISEMFGGIVVWAGLLFWIIAIFEAFTNGKKTEEKTD